MPAAGECFLSAAPVAILQRMRLTLIAVMHAAAACCQASRLPAQNVALQVERAGHAPAALSLDLLRRLPSDTVSRSSHGAPPVRYRGVKVTDVLAAAGTPIDSLRLGHAAWIVVAVARDGYVAAFSAGELDPKLGSTRVVLALDRDGTALTADEAPFQLIVTSDSHASRSARQVTTLRVLDALPAAARP